MTAVLLLAAGCGDDSDESVANESGGGRVPVIVDTDAGADDAIALLYLLQHPGVDVLAITVSGTGLTHCDPGVGNVAGLVELAAPEMSIPITCGRDTPLEGSRAFPDEWREQADGRYGGIFPSGEPISDDRSAVDVLAETVADAGRPVTLLTLGPLTNLADALAQAPGVADDIASVVVMGGALDAGGNVEVEGEPGARTTEWNMYVDPTAAQDVLDSNLDVTLAPLDTQTPIDVYDVRALAEEAASPAGSAVAELLASSPFFVSEGFFLWDPLAAGVVADPDRFIVTVRRVRVVMSGAEAGRTVADQGRDVGVATLRRRNPFVAGLLGILAGRDAPLDISEVPDTMITVADDGCVLSSDRIEAGPVVLAGGSTGLVAVGTLEQGRTPEDVDAYLASDPVGPPPWFPTVALLQPLEGQPPAVYLDAEPGQLDVVCIAIDGTSLSLAGAATLTVVP
jgi:pyrimidine-specific ribonucleoside hydrolase